MMQISQVLCKAASLGNTDILNQYIHKRVDIDAKNNKGEWPLANAVKSNEVEATRLLLSSGADPNARADNGDTLLTFVIFTGHREICNLLIDHGADVNLSRADGTPPVCLAAWMGMKDIYKVMINKGAKYDIRKDLFTSLCLAVQDQYGEIWENFRSRGVDVTGKDGTNVLCSAAVYGHGDIIKFLIQKGVEVNSRNQKGVLALGNAIWNKEVEAVKLLLSSGADANASTGSSGHTLLTLASVVGKHEICNLLIEHGADVNLAHANGTRPIYLAAWKGKKDIVQLLVNKGARCDTSHDLFTALSLVPSEKYNKVWVEIKNQGVDVTGPDGTNVLCSASAHGRTDIITFLIQKGVEVNTRNGAGIIALGNAVWNNEVEATRLLLSSGADPNARADNGDTLLILVSSTGHREICNLLIEHGADVNLPRPDGTPPVCLAAWMGKKHIVQLLVDNGAMYDSSRDLFTKLCLVSWEKYDKVWEQFATEYQDVMGKYTVNALCKSVIYKRIDIFNFLRERVDVNGSNDEGDFALYEAARSGYDNICKGLLSVKIDAQSKVSIFLK